MARGSHYHFLCESLISQRWDPLMMHGCGKFSGLINYS